MGKVVVNTERCKGCALCVEFCPKDVLVLGNETNDSGYYTVIQKDLDGCNGCALCAIMCPDLSLEVYKQSSIDGEEK